MIVVKVGGSLYDHPGLGPGLDHFLDSLLRTEPVWLVPGGGWFTDSVRELDRVHQFRDEISHWLALRSLSTAALFLAAFLPDATVTNEATGFFGEGLSILDPYEFTLSTERQDFVIPTTWDVTSDSLAAYAAVWGQASRLILLKSIEIPLEMSWDLAADRGMVDRNFPTVVDAHDLVVEAINFRRWLDGRPLTPRP